ncbi:MAG: glycosyltransferase family 87 protein [Isosphaeraceae bacterium]
MTRSLVLPAVLILLMPMAVLSLAKGGKQALASSKDLMYRYAEVARFKAGADPYQLSSMTYPPTALPVFTPLVAPFGPNGVKWAWLLGNLATLAVLCWAVVRVWGEGWPPWLKAALVLTVAASNPVRWGIGLGQFHLIPTTLMVLATLAVRGRRQVLAGALVGIALAKPTMVLPFLGVWAVKGHWRALAVAIAVQGALFLGASAWLGMDPMNLVREWLATAKGELGAGSIDVPTLIRESWSEASALGTTLIVLLIAFALTFAYRRRPEPALVAFSLFNAAVFTYHRPYDLVLLVPPFASAIASARGSRGGQGVAGWLLAAVFALVLIVPRPPIGSGRFEAWYDGTIVVLAYVLLARNLLDLARSKGNDPSELPRIA